MICLDQSDHRAESCAAIYLVRSRHLQRIQRHTLTMPFSLFASSVSELRIDISVSVLGKPVFTTLENVTGRVIFAPAVPVKVNEVVIDFIGRATTWVDPVSPGTSRRWGRFEVLFLLIGTC